MKPAQALLVGAALLANGGLVAPSAGASDMPFYDPAACCRQVANAVGGSEVIRGGCFNNEQAAYDSLKARWPVISRQTRLQCDQVSRAVGGTYVILQGCIQNEEAAAAQNYGQTFRR